MSDKDESSNIGPMIRKEKQTVEKLIRLYCDNKHPSSIGTLCSQCHNLLEYSHQRLDQCRYQDEKLTCRKCPTHCYKPNMREEIRQVMRFSGPRLAFRAPVNWIKHRIRGIRNSDSRKK